MIDGNTYVNLLYKRKNELIKICNYHGLHGYDCDDIIQDLYVVILLMKNPNKYAIDDTPNMFIIFAIIKNLIYHYRKKEKRYSSKDLYDFDLIDDAYQDGRCITFILDEIENIDNWFEKNILTLYITKKMSIRKLAKETKIDYWFIQPVVHKFKQQVQTAYQLQENEIKNQINI